MSSTCVDPISTSFSPNPQEVTSGDDALFTETVSVAAGDFGAVEGAEVEIEITSGPNAGTMTSGLTDANGQVSLTWTPWVDPASLGTDSVSAWLLNPDGVRVASTDAAKNWVDTTPPTATCVETVNPHGKKIPQAPGKGGQAQNQDGFYVLGGADVVWPSDSLALYVTDDGSGTVFGPYAIGTTINYTEADASPQAKTIRGPNSATDWHIIGNGDGVLTVVDGSGNVSAGAACPVPPARK
jgi:hypothetical protein